MYEPQKIHQDFTFIKHHTYDWFWTQRTKKII